jgi:hypothetical protein
MREAWVAYSQVTGVNGRRPVIETLDAALERTVRRASLMRQSFYVVVLLVALAGQVSGAVQALRIPLAAAIPAVAALELGGIVVLANADVRRRLGERAIGSRLLSVAIAAGAVAFNWLAHADHLLGGFFAGMSALGYLVWLTHTENQRRDRLRATGDLPPTTPAYEIVGHWLRHPWLTRRARSLAKANPDLGLYASLAAAQAEIRRDRRHRAILKVLHRKIRAAVDPMTADIAVAVYDLDEIAARLAGRADYDGLTDLIAADLTPARLAPPEESATRPTPGALTPSASATAEGTAEATDAAGTERATTERATTEPPRTESAAGGAPEVEPAAASAPSGALTETSGQFRVLAAVRRELEDLSASTRATGGSGTDATAEADQSATGSERVGADRPAGSARKSTGRAAQPATSQPATAQRTDGEVPESSRRRSRAADPGASRTAAPAPAAQPQVRLTDDPESARNGTKGDLSLRSRVHAALDEHAPRDGREGSTELVDLVAEVLQLNDVERISAASYVQTWKRDVGRVTRTPIPQQAGSAARR